MAERSGYSDLVEAQRDTAAQLLAVVSALERMQANGVSAASHGGLRDSSANEALTLLRQVVLLPTPIQSSQSDAQVATYGGLRDSSAGEALTLLRQVALLPAPIQSGQSNAQVATHESLRDSSAGEALTLLRQVVRLLTLIQSSQSDAQVATYGGLRGSSASEALTLLRQVVLMPAPIQSGQSNAQVATHESLRDSSASEALTLLRQVVRLLTLIQSTQAVLRGATQGTGGTEGRGGGIEGFFGTLLGIVSKGLAVASIVTSIVGLFRGPRRPESEPIPFNAPGSLALEVANTDQILRGFPRFDFSATGERRLAEDSGKAAAFVPPAGGPSGPPPEPPVQINVNVSAMDSRSFRDHAPELAEAVRDAMLHLHPINQVVRDI